MGMIECVFGNLFDNVLCYMLLGGMIEVVMVVF